jgi:Fic family protein
LEEEADPNLLCDPTDKARLEGANGLEQIEYVSEVVQSGAKELRESHHLQLHRLAVQGIYRCAGSFRKVPVTVGPYKPPEAWRVQLLSAEAIDWINSNQNQRSTLERAAYALWRFNWIHPFAGGNGRTSRAVAYLIICMRDGVLLPGKPTVPALIYQNRDRYVQGLRAADAADADGHLDFSVMTAFLREMVMLNMAAAINRMSGAEP